MLVVERRGCDPRRRVRIPRSPPPARRTYCRGPCRTSSARSTLLRRRVEGGQVALAGGTGARPPKSRRARSTRAGSAERPRTQLVTRPDCRSEAGEFDSLRGRRAYTGQSWRRLGLQNPSEIGFDSLPVCREHEAMQVAPCRGSPRQSRNGKAGADDAGDGLVVATGTRRVRTAEIGVRLPAGPPKRGSRPTGRRRSGRPETRVRFSPAPPRGLQVQAAAMSEVMLGALRQCPRVAGAQRCMVSSTTGFDSRRGLRRPMV